MYGTTRFSCSTSAIRTIPSSTNIIVSGNAGSNNHDNNNNNNDGEMNSGPVILKPSEVPEDIICSICMTVPQDPVVTTKCDHVFCRNCLYQSIQQAGPFCPIDRNVCRFDDDVINLKEGTFIYRIWCNVQVKCQYYHRGCSWTGSIQDFVKSHKESCFYNNTNRTRKRLYPFAAAGGSSRYGSVEDSEEYIELEEKFDTLENEHTKIKTEYNQLKVENERINIENECIKTELLDVKGELNDFRTECRPT